RAEKVDLVEIKMRKNLNYDDVKVLKKIAIDGKINDRWIISCLEHKITIERTARNVPWWEAARTLK
ncbi:hypothetical protein JW998_02440, partial [candidate division KSB1 bacterium]|nr:hypothetical protein [candidate division KSB1 bacterium]